MWPLTFISEADFHRHIDETIQYYGGKLEPYDLQKLNKHFIDPIKLIFDKIVYQFSWEEIVKNEIFRQRDKSNNNDIGYFHQRIFQYIQGCEVPQSGWDVILAKDSGIQISEDDRVNRVFVELKNKHNTMNSSSSAKTYIKMQSQILSDDECACFLVEVIAKQKKKHRLIRRVSIDQFYALVTGQEDAFYQLCMVLPGAIERTIAFSTMETIPKDSAFDELKSRAGVNGRSFPLALYLLGFSSYNGFNVKYRDTFYE